MAERKLQFIKMDGLGNDFVILDGRSVPVALDSEEIINIASRENGETGGCDQVIVMKQSDGDAVFMQIYNADGGEVDACGNASRCVAKLVAEEKNVEEVALVTAAGRLQATMTGPGEVTVDMGEPGLGWQDIPIAEERDTIDLGVGEGELQNPVGVSMGNPHAVFFVDDVEKINLQKLGPVLENHPVFPQRANIGVAQILDERNIRLRVWERGVGETKACGTGACATAVAANRKELVNDEVTVHLNGGDLQIIWDKDSNHVMMTGAVSQPQRGELTLK